MRQRDAAALTSEEWEPAAYGAWFESPLGRRVWADEERALMAVLEPEATWSVLDAGCGEGRFARHLAITVRHVTGADTSEAMLHAARLASTADRPVDLVAGDVGRLPFAASSFDAVTAVTVLCFVPNPLVMLRELARVVRPGGRVVIGELGRWSTWAALRRVRARRHGGRWRAARFWTRRRLSSALQGVGLAPQSVRGAVFYPKSALLARLCAPLERCLGGRTTFGAAFIAVAAAKPPAMLAGEAVVSIPAVRS